MKKIIVGFSYDSNEFSHIKEPEPNKYDKEVEIEVTDDVASRLDKLKRASDQYWGLCYSLYHEHQGEEL